MMADESTHCDSLDKFSVNKKIVSMRSVVQRTKTHTINKLAREAKNLKYVKNGLPAPQTEKRIAKAERLIGELLVIKTLTNDDISKLALVSTKEALDALRADPSSSVEQKAMARLASNSLLIETVNQFRSRFPQWKATLSSLIDNLGVKVKQHKNKSVSTLVGSTVVLEKKGNTEKQQSIVNKSIKSNVMVGHKEENVVINKKQQHLGCNLKTIHGNWKVEDVDEICDPKESSDKPEHKDQIISTNNKTTTKQSVKPITKTKSMKVAPFSEFVAKSSPKLVDEAATVSAEKTVDSFFVAEDGQTEFLSTVTLKEHVKDSEPTVSHKYDKMRETYFSNYGRVPNRRELRSQEKQSVVSNLKTFQSTFSQKTDEGWSNKSKSKVSVVVHPVQQKRLDAKPNAPPDEGPVHPSWEAKRKQKEMLSISAFQGKKIKFDDN